MGCGDQCHQTGTIDHLLPCPFDVPIAKKNCWERPTAAGAVVVSSHEDQMRTANHPCVGLP